MRVDSSLHALCTCRFVVCRHSVLSELERQGLWDGDVPQQPLTPLSSPHIELLDELTRSYTSSLEITVERDMPRDNCHNFADLVNIAEVSVRRVIAMAKQVRSFKALPQGDQISLLKGGSIELLILRSVITFDKEKQHFLDPMDQESVHAMNVDQLRAAHKGDGLFEDHMKFVKSLAVDLKADQNTLILLLMISLFSPDRPSLVNKELVSDEQEKYSELLQRYLESRYPVAIVRAVYPKLLMKLTDIRNLNEEHSQVLLKVNPEVLQPLMKEVLDVKATDGVAGAPANSTGSPAGGAGAAAAAAAAAAAPATSPNTVTQRSPHANDVDIADHSPSPPRQVAPLPTPTAMHPPTLHAQHHAPMQPPSL